MELFIDRFLFWYMHHTTKTGRVTAADCCWPKKLFKPIIPLKNTNQYFLSLLTYRLQQIRQNMLISVIFSSHSFRNILICLNYSFTTSLNPNCTEGRDMNMFVSLHDFSTGLLFEKPNFLSSHQTLIQFN